MEKTENLKRFCDEINGSFRESSNVGSCIFHHAGKKFTIYVTDTAKRDSLWLDIKGRRLYQSFHLYPVATCTFLKTEEGGRDNIRYKCYEEELVYKALIAPFLEIIYSRNDETSVRIRVRDADEEVVQEVKF